MKIMISFLIAQLAIIWLVFTSKYNLSDLRSDLWKQRSSFVYKLFLPFSKKKGQSILPALIRAVIIVMLIVADAVVIILTLCGVAENVGLIMYVITVVYVLFSGINMIVANVVTQKRINKETDMLILKIHRDIPEYAWKEYAVARQLFYDTGRNYSPEDVKKSFKRIKNS